MCFVGPLRQSSNESSYDDIEECLEGARDECTSCPTLTDEEQLQRRQCRACVMRCVQTSGTRKNSN